MVKEVLDIMRGLARTGLTMICVTRGDMFPAILRMRRLQTYG